MPLISRGFRNSALTLAALLALHPPQVRATVVTTTYIGPDNGLWSNAANWSGGVPNNSGTLTYGAVISASPRTVQMNFSSTIDTLALGSSDVLALNSSLTIAGGSIINNGTILLNIPFSSLIVKTDTVLSGAGSVVLAGSFSTLDSAVAVRLFSDNAISGQGTIGGAGTLKFVNTGSITATAGTLTLHPYNSTAVTDSFVNLGTFAADGGTLALATGYYNNAGGVIQARANSLVTVASSSVISGGSLGADAGGAVTFGPGPVTLANVSLSGFLQTSTVGSLIFSGSIANSGTLASLGSSLQFGVSATTPATFTNTGLIQAGSVSTLLFFSDTTLAGAGTLALDGNAFSASSNSGVPWRLTNQNVISGRGTLGNSGLGIFLTNAGTIAATTGVLSILGSSYTNQSNILAYINTGVLRAAGGTLNLIGSSNPSLGYANTGGTIEALANSVVAITGNIISGGTIRAADGGSITLSNSALTNLTLGGGLFQAASSTSLFTLVGNIANASTVTLAGSLGLGSSGGSTLTLQNAGLIQFGRTDGAVTTTVMVWASTAITGGGSITLNNSGAPPFSSSAAAPRLSSDNFISGAGTLGSGGANGTLLTNTGTITASGGVLTLLGGYNSNFSTPVPSSYNTGILRADGGTLNILNSINSISAPIINTNGIIEALPNSLVSISYGSISGGILRSLPGGTVTLLATTLSDIALDGLIQVPAPQGASVSGTISNIGLLDIGLPSGQINGPVISLATDSKFIGAGTISLRGGGIVTGNTNGTITQLTNATFITGYGNIGNQNTSPLFRKINSGTITASGGVLVLYVLSPFANSTSDVANSGLLNADGGTLTLSGTINANLDNTNGLIQARPNSVVNIGGIIFSGGTVSALPGGTVNWIGGTVSNTSLNGIMQTGTTSGSSGLTLLGSVANAGTLVLGGNTSMGAQSFSPPAADVNILNAGFIQIGLTPGGFTSFLNLNANVAFSRGGTVSLIGISASGPSSGAARLTNDNFMSGNGALVNGPMLFTNTGTITATSGTLTLASNGVSSGVTVNYNQGLLSAQGGTLLISSNNLRPTLDNTLGVIQAGANSIVSLVSQPLQGGALRSVNGGTVSLSGSSLTNVSVQGLFQLVPSNGNTFAGVMTTTGNLTINGIGTTLNIGPLGPPAFTVVDNPWNLQFGASLPVALNGDVFLTGGGSFTLNNNLVSVPSSLARLTSDNAILGRGTLGSSVTKITNTGAISATTGVLVIQTSFASDGFLSTGTIGADGGTLSILSPLNASAGSVQTAHNGVINFNGSGALIAGPILLNSGAVNFLTGTNPTTNSITTVSGSGALTVATSVILTSDGVTVTSLTNAGTLIIRPNASNSGTSKVNTLTLAASGSAFTSALDLTNNKFILEADPAIPGDKSAKLAFLHSALLAGFDGGDWLGKGITSSTVAADQSPTGSHMTTLALFDNADLGLASFGGQTVDANSILITTALLGDANLDGVVNPSDLLMWAHNFNNATYSAAAGDFNNDGVVNPSDLLIWAHNYNNSLTPGIPFTANSPSLDGSPVPEPTTALVLAVPLLLLSRRRSPRSIR